MKVVPNIFTLLNLFFGCLAITMVLQNELVFTTGSEGESMVVLPEKMYMASLFIALAAVIDFFDGLVARLCKVASEMGKQLDSLADVVSFGVAPGMIIYQFLRLAFAQQPGGLDTSTLWLLPAFILPCAGAYRLARYNVDIMQVFGFSGVPIPAAGLLIASFPLIYWNTDVPWIYSLLLNTWFWFAVVAILSYLMVSTLPMMALKFKDLSVKNNMPKIVLLLVAVAAAFTLKWLAIPATFLAYVMISLFVKVPEQPKGIDSLEVTS
jgi:CDP-diacylglycerol--serine O-phosphatidyltransferase